MKITIEILLTLLAVDFVSGFVHWLEDTYWTEDTPLVGNWIARPNILHHRDGMAFLKNSWLRSSWDLLLLGGIVVAVAKLLGVLDWHVWLFAIVGGNSNQIHKWAHMRRSAVPAPIRFLQRIHILQSPAGHAKHHVNDGTGHYCVVTDLLNPLLDGTGFWKALQWLATPIVGTPRRGVLGIGPRPVRSA